MAAVLTPRFSGAVWRFGYFWQRGMYTSALTLNSRNKLTESLGIQLLTVLELKAERVKELGLKKLGLKVGI